MKKNIIKYSTTILITFIGFIVTSFAQNGTGGAAGGSTGMTWEEIKVSEFFRAEFPVYKIEKYVVPYDELCIAQNDLIRSKQKYLVDWIFKEDGNSIYKYDFVSRPREIIKRVCVDVKESGDCVWEEISDSIPLEKEIKVNRFEEGEWKLDDTRDYQLDSCENYRNTIII